MFALGHVAAQTTHQSSLALVGATVYPSPQSTAINDAVVVITAGKIIAVGARASISIPSDARLIRCEGLFVTAGFQNSHVHFTEDKWNDAPTQSATTLTSNLRSMLTRYGFTTVVDTGSLLPNTVAIRKRIESGDVAGPRILTAGPPLYPPNGVPYYVREGIPPDLLKLLPQPGTPDEAVAAVRKNFDGGGDLVKLFTGSWVSRQRVVPMPLEVASAATAEAHRRGRMVFTHPSNLAGLEVALSANVDVLAHAVENTDGLTPEHLRRMKQHDMALIPTLKLFGAEHASRSILAEVADYATSGGQILFGTDVGYITDYDPLDEYLTMAKAGLSWQQIWASLTTNPSARFRESARRGQVAKGMDGDIVVLGSDPAKELRAFADVRYTIRAGRVIFP